MTHINNQQEVPRPPVDPEEVMRREHYERLAREASEQ